MGTWRARLTVAIVGATLLGGCTSTSAGEPGPAHTVPSETESSAPPSSAEQDDLPSDGAPAVTNPFDADRIEQNPCEALTDTQATELNLVPPGKAYDGTFGNACEWRGPDLNDGRAAIDFLSDEPRGLSSVYRSNSRGEFAFFEPIDPVAGHPMAAFGVDDAREKGGQCAVAVGLTDELVFTVFLNLSAGNIGHKDPCEIGSQVAEMMLTTMGAA